MTLEILETALYADDLEAAETFYTGVLGLEVILRAEGRHVFFRLGSSVLLMFNPTSTETQRVGDALSAPPHGARGPGHACFKVGSEGLDAWRQKLTKAGIAIETEITWPNGAQSIYFRDPAGNSLEIGEAKMWGFE